MIELGPITGGALRVALAARKAVIESGQVAVLVSQTTGEAVAIPYTTAGYDWYVRRHASHLIGVYTDEVSDDHALDSLQRALLLREITDDLAEHLKQSRWWLLARVQRRRRAA